MSTIIPTSPSRKRSKWDNDDADADQMVYSPILLKRTKKSKPATTASATTEPTTPGILRQTPAKPAYSVYVPPRTHHPAMVSSRSVYSYERLNQIEEGSYGVVFRARDKQSKDIVALKKLKLDEEKHGFPITALREINALMACQHENVVRIREVCVGDTLTQ